MIYAVSTRDVVAKNKISLRIPISWASKTRSRNFFLSNFHEKFPCLHPTNLKKVVMNESNAKGEGEKKEIFRDSFAALSHMWVSLEMLINYILNIKVALL